MSKMTLGKRINAARKDRGLTAEMLSEMCHINATYVRQIEGSGKIPSMAVFIELCNALKISPDYLLQDGLSSNELTEIRELAELWKRAKPSDQALVAAMGRSALEHLEQNK